MTRAGVVFAILNLLIAVFYVLVTAPVVNYRIEKRQQIQKIVDEQIPRLKQQIAELEVEKGKKPIEINRELDRITTETTAGLNEKELLETRLAILADEVNDFGSRLKVLAKSVEDVRGEVTNRKGEVAQLNQQLAAGNEAIARRDEEINDLTTRLNDATTKNEQARKRIDETHKRIASLEQKLPDNTTKKVADRRD